LLYRESVAIRRKKKGDTHPDVVKSIKDLAGFHLNQGKLDEAERLIRDLLSAQRKALGNENREVAKTLGSLAALLIDHGRPAEGEPLARESLALHQRLYGEATVEAFGAAHDLAIALDKQGRYAEAELLLRDVLVMERKLMPPDSGGLDKTIYNLALNLDRQQKRSEAEPLFRERVEFRRKYPSTNPESLEGRLADLADTLYRGKKYAEAEPVYRELIESRGKRLPTEHEDVFSPKASLARLLADWAWVDRTNLVAADVRRLKSEPETQNSKTETGKTLATPAALRPVDHAREAERLLRQSLAHRLQGTNATHWRTADMRSRLGGAILSLTVTDPGLTSAARQAKFAETEALLLEGNDGIPSDRSSARYHKRDALERLVHLYEALDKPAQAAAWREKLDAFNQTSAPNDP
jgi:hypothetical protein